MKSKLSQTLWWLMLLTLLGFCLRVFQVGDNPVILNRDEAALAYNAYLLNEVGQDEWGKPWPLALESFGDFKLPGYPLILSALFSFLPLADWVVRLPSALAGTFLIPLSYLFARRFDLNEKLSLFFALLVTLTPVFFFYSRVAFEANVGLTLFIGAVVLLLTTSIASSTQLTLDVLALIVMILAVFTYNTPLLLVPFMIPILVVWRGVKKWRSWLLPVIGLALIFGVTMSILMPLTAQKSGITIFTDESTWRFWIAYRESLPASLQSTLGSQYLYWLGVMISNFIQSFLPKFLLIEGGTHPWHSLPQWGHLTISTYMLGLVGLVGLIFTLRFKHTRDVILLYLLMVSLAPSIITVDAPHTTRSLFFIYLFVLFAVKGVAQLQKIMTVKYFLAILIVVFFIESSLYLYHYFYRFLDQQQAWLPGFEQVIQEVEAKYPTAEVAIVDGGGFQYILTAWYLKLPAEEYLSHNIRQLPDKIGFRYGERVTHYHFIVQPQDRKAEKILVSWDGNEWRIEE